MTDISFVIVNYNSLAYIRDLLKSFFDVFGSIKIKNSLKRDFSQPDFPEWEIIIFDNGSVDGSIQFIEEETCKHKSIMLVKSKTNAGFCRGSNEGAKKAAGRYLVFLNPDTKIIDSRIENLINFVCQREKNNERVGVVGVKTINADESLQYTCRSFPTIARQFFESYFLFKIFKKSKLFGSYFMTWWDHQSSMEVDWLTGSFIFIKKEVFHLIGGFDEDYFMYSEDTDLCLRLNRKGYKNYYFSDYKIMHLDSAVASRNMAARELGIWRSRRLYFKKNYSELSARIVSTLYFFGILNRLFLYLILYIFTFNKSLKTKINLYARTLKPYF
ncbi:MAG: glycosyltransferase [Actinobacteria bacterium]|nr:glycosyltransferase [Actinomycetota bacterium]